jgi:hypothetical protein
MNKNFVFMCFFIWILSSIMKLSALEESSEVTSHNKTQSTYNLFLKAGKINWRSFPTIEQNNKDLFYFTKSYLAEVMDQTDYLFIIDQFLYSLTWNMFLWNGFLSDISPIVGYKIETNYDVNIPLQGTKTDDDTIIPLKAGENWIGYFIEEPMNVYDAFKNIWEFVYVVYGENWAFSKEGLFPYERCVLEFSGMYNVIVLENCNLVYSKKNTPVYPLTRPLTQGFTYKEKRTYVPIEIAFITDSYVLEIGVFQGNDCIGAAIVDDFPLQLLSYYSTGESKDVRFDFYYGDNTYKVNVDFLVYDENTQSYQNGPIWLRKYQFVNIAFESSMTNDTYIRTEQFLLALVKYQRMMNAHSTHNLASCATSESDIPIRRQHLQAAPNRKRRSHTSPNPTCQCDKKQEKK